MIEYKKWEIWEAVVPYEDKIGSKKRPVIILSGNEKIVLSIKMTSHTPRHHILEGEYEILQWKEAGLQKPTVAQCSKILKLDEQAFTNKKYGTLTHSDIAGIKSILHYVYNSYR